jgi:hypothetical protein
LFAVFVFGIFNNWFKEALHLRLRCFVRSPCYDINAQGNITIVFVQSLVSNVSHLPRTQTNHPAELESRKAHMSYCKFTFESLFFDHIMPPAHGASSFIAIQVILAYVHDYLQYILAFIFSSLGSGCCVIQIIATMCGWGCTGLAIMLDPYRKEFVLMTFVSVVYSFFFHCTTWNEFYKILALAILNTISPEIKNCLNYMVWNTTPVQVHLVVAGIKCSSCAGDVKTV